MNSIFRLMAMAALLVITMTAQAGVITNTGDNFVETLILANGANDGNGNTNNTGQDISVDLTFELADAVGSDILLNITATNTTAVNDDEVGLYMFGFGIDPDAIGVSFMNDSYDPFNDATLSTFPAFPDSALIDITAATGPGAPKNLQAGETDFMQVVISFGSGNYAYGDAITIDPINVFVQSDPDSFQFGATVPAPAGGLLLLLGLVLMTATRLRPAS